MSQDFQNTWSYDIQSPDEFPDSISVSIIKNDINTLRQLLDECKRTQLPQTTHFLKWTPLHLAASKSRRGKILELLLSYSDTISMDINAVTCRRETALYIACENNCEENVLMLLHKGCDPYIVNSNRYSALHIAAERGYLNIVEYLLNYPQNINQQDYTGQAPLHLAVEYNRLQICRILLEKGANTTSTDLKKNIPLHLACRKRNFDMIRLLVEYDSIPINYKNSNGTTPIMLVAGHAADPQITLFLLKNGAKTDICDTQGRMALHFAVNSGNTELLQYVLNNTDEDCIRQWFLDIPKILRTECILHSFTGCAIEGGNVECLKILLSSDKFSRSILQAPFIKRDLGVCYVYSPLAFVFNFVDFDDEKLNSFMEVLLNNRITKMDEFFNTLKIEWPSDKIKFQNPFSKIFNYEWSFSKQERYFKQFNANNVTIDYCLQCYHDNTQPFFTFTDYKSYYEPVMAVIHKSNIEILKLIMSNSAILEPDELIVQFNKFTESDEPLSMIEYFEIFGLDDTEIQKKYRSVNQYLISLKPIYYNYNKLCHRINNSSWYPYPTISEEFTHLTLKKICRTAIRKSLREPTLDGNLRNFRRNILELPLPTRLKDYLLFEN
ncbi:hypothetical protein V9T40_011133 [Parthenolecanium corni]|uniref:SOCS box domain-containing protein n=1 Tax=Parthenolecanium corni TaxID=536013 RepID=A0AAN9XY44_9HEMI